MRWALPGGRSALGCANPMIPGDGENPRRVLDVKPFAISRYAVTNGEFADFVSETGYRTSAERYGWSFVFKGFLPEDVIVPGPAGAPWWRKTEGSCWKHPEGAGSDVEARRDHPVVHLSWFDAGAFASWAGGRLPTEAEWEYAARGGLPNAIFPWGDQEPDDDSYFPCNIWQGQFPDSNSAADGYTGTAPVDAYAPNGFGLFNMAGNVWEWCADPFRIRSLKREARERNDAARAQNSRVAKGGSYLCHRCYCYRYRVAARTGTTPDTSTGHMGLRLAFDDR